MNFDWWSFIIGMIVGIAWMLLGVAIDYWPFNKVRKR